MPSQSARALLSSLIDYAGLFPPAKLEMKASVENFARYLRGEHEWMLGHFICPVSQLEAFSRDASALLPGTFATSGYREHARGEPWSLSVIIDGELDDDLDAIDSFNEHHSHEENGLAAIDAIELKAPNVDFIDHALDQIPDYITPYFEFSVVNDPRGFIAALSGNQAAAKIRTGGVAAEAFPTPEQVAQFIVACAAADVPFKATAGLHHMIRGDNKLTYEKDSKSCTMHGFLNLFVAAAVAKVRRSEAGTITKLLTVTDPKSFVFVEEGVRVMDFAIDAVNLAKVRETFALSFGSCSFEEPVQELTAAGIL